MRADAIVVAFRSASVIEECMQSLRSDPAIDRIVVVNNSLDAETREITARLSGTVFLQQPENIGFGRAVNRARLFVRNDFVVLANPDTVQTGTTTSEALAFLERRKLVGILGPRMITSDGEFYQNSQREIGLWGIATQALIDRHHRTRDLLSAVGLAGHIGERRPASEHLVPHATEYVIGSFLVCRRAALDDVGWFDESIFLFGEDQDLCRRMRRSGWQVWYAPLGEVTHLSGHSWRQLSDQGRAHFHEARYRELLRARGPIQAAVYRHLSRLLMRLSASQNLSNKREATRRKLSSSSGE